MTIAAQSARRSFERLVCSLTVTLLLIAGASLVAEAAWIDAKAWLAQRLLERAWTHAQNGGGEPKPWPWADTYPVARLRFARQGVSQIVLAGASGPTLAFGPGHVAGTARPGTAGNVAIAGHRDTHFAILRDARPGDVIELEAPDGTMRTYHVKRTDVVDESETELLRDASDRLTLVTCYPFDAVRPGGRLRWVVTAEP